MSVVRLSLCILLTACSSDPADTGSGDDTGTSEPYASDDTGTSNDSSTSDSGDSPEDCAPDELLCDDACRPCPTDHVSTVTCDLDACVIDTCASGYQECGDACMPNIQGGLTQECVGDELVATTCQAGLWLLDGECSCLPEYDVNSPTTVPLETRSGVRSMLGCANYYGLSDVGSAHLCGDAGDYQIRIRGPEESFFTAGLADINACTSTRVEGAECDRSWNSDEPWHTFKANHATDDCMVLDVVYDQGEFPANIGVDVFGPMDLLGDGTYAFGVSEHTIDFEGIEGTFESIRLHRSPYNSNWEWAYVTETLPSGEQRVHNVNFQWGGAGSSIRVQIGFGSTDSTFTIDESQLTTGTVYAVDVEGLRVPRAE